ncbi:MAG: hypothetical protein EGQ27_02870 [Lactobacillus ruminis]|nr:hypothetical protein [Ligilactobacillus ruminis]
MKKSHVSLWEWVPDNAVDLRLVLSGIFSTLRHGNLFFQMQCRVSSAQTVRQDGFAGKSRSLRAPVSGYEKIRMKFAIECKLSWF